LPDLLSLKNRQFDRTHVILAILVYLTSFIVYLMTVQRSIPFWDCGEFIAASAILGVPHPPGFPLMVMIGRLASLVPFVTDIAYRINLLSVFFSPFTAMIGYLLTVKLVSYFFNGEPQDRLSRFIMFAGGVAGGLFVAFSETNWGSSVEAEVYCPATGMAVLLVYLTILYFERRGTSSGILITVLVFYLALLATGLAMMSFLVMPICSIFYVLKKEADRRDFLIVCGFIIAELVLVIVFANGRGGAQAYAMVSAVLVVSLLVMLYKKINWAMAIAVGLICTIIVANEWFIWAMIIGLPAFAGLSFLAHRNRWQFDYRPALAIMVAAVIGFSVQFYIPVRSSQNPRIDENHPSRSFATFVGFLDRKQYGSESMVHRMFQRRGTWENQFGWHPHMGFWSYFEEQYSTAGAGFVPFFILGVIGMVVAIRKRLEIGLPFLTVFLVCSMGLILYMNFADGTKYDFNTGDAYLEVRDRDYFWITAFVFFGVAMGAGISAVMQWVRQYVARRRNGFEAQSVYASALLALLPIFGLTTNYHINDRFGNNLATEYGKNILDSCPQDAIIFTSGDNDTFPVWALQEAYNYRKDVRVVNLSLFNTDWYVAQMKNQYGVPISLSDDQILWNQYDVGESEPVSRPDKPFYDKPRKREAYMVPSRFENRIVKVQDMMVDEVVLENRWRYPIYFSSPPYSESPLKLRDHAALVGNVYELEKDPTPGLVEVDRSYDLFMNKYSFGGMENSKVFRDENATGVFIGLGINGTRIVEELARRGDTTRAITLANKLIGVYPEYWQTYMTLADIYDKKGDSAKSDQLYQQLVDTLKAFTKADPRNLFWRQDLGLSMFELGKRRKDQLAMDQGIKFLWSAFEADPNSSYGFRKLFSALSQAQKYEELQRAARMFAEYKVNLTDPFLQRILGISPPSGINPED
jgi:tetratricopeptide (TPR) repeat protein